MHHLLVHTNQDITLPNSALDLRRRSTSSMCEKLICKVQIYRNEIRLHTNYTMQYTVGGVDVTLSMLSLILI